MPEETAPDSLESLNQQPDPYIAPTPAVLQQETSTGTTHPNTSGTGKSAVVPPEIKGSHSWPALILSFIWGVPHKVYFSLLNFIPYIGIVVPFILFFKGNEWAWQNRRWESIEHFQMVQKKWTKAAVIWLFIVACIAFTLIMLYVVPMITAEEPVATAEPQSPVMAEEKGGAVPGALSFDFQGKKFVLGWQESVGGQTMYEFYLEGEASGKWNELITIVRDASVPKDQVTPQVMASIYLRTLENMKANGATVENTYVLQKEDRPDPLQNLYVMTLLFPGAQEAEVDLKKIFYSYQSEPIAVTYGVRVTGDTEMETQQKASAELARLKALENEFLTTKFPFPWTEEATSVPDETSMEGYLAMQSDSGEYKVFADKIIEELVKGNTQHLKDNLSPSLVRENSEANLQAFLQASQDLFANHERLGNSDTIRPSTDYYGNPGYSFARSIIRRDGTEQPFKIYVIKEGDRLVIGNVVDFH